MAETTRQAIPQAQFESILKKGRLLEDEFVREHVENLLRTIRTQVLKRVLRLYTPMSLQAIANELNDISVQDMETLLVSLILDKKLGWLDRSSGRRLDQEGRKGIGRWSGKELGSKSIVVLRCEALDEMADPLKKLSNSIASTRINVFSSSLVHGMVI
jgi:COP9 signalosome complex subunit 2